MDRIPLPIYDLDAGPLRVQREKWRHLAPHRRITALRNIRAHQAALRRRLTTR